jgi:lysophospholipase L1-like esterase
MSARLGRLALVCSALLLALSLAELLWRAARTSQYGPTTNPSYVLHDPELGWRYRPGARARHLTSEFDVEVRVNDQGFRDAPFPPPGGLPEPTILALGDSQTFGWGVAAEQAFPSRLQEELGMRVLNLGVSGYGTDQEWLLWQRSGRALRPRLVILTVCANDTREVYRPAMYGREKPRFTLVGEQLLPPGAPVPRRRFTEWSHLLRSLWSSRLKAANPPLKPEEIDPARRLQAALTRALALDVTGADVHLLIVVQDESWLTASLAEPLSGRAGVALLDVAPALAEAALQEPVAFTFDPHWNARGHAVVAETIAAAIRAAGWLP